LQYAAVRAGAVLEKAKKQGVIGKQVGKIVLPEQVTLLEKLISRFPDVVAYARADYAPQHIANYLIAVAGAFNSYYASNQIINETDPLTPYRLNLTQAFLTTMTNGLWLLGIKVPKKM
jgi:arginyl-tRNA synthetase